MRQQELTNIIAAIIILAAIASFSFVIKGEWQAMIQVIFFSIIIVFVSVFAKKLMAFMLDSGVEHEIWKVYRYGWKPGWHFKEPIPAGIVFPLFFSVFSLGLLKIASILTYESRALKSRVSRRFGFYSYAEMTDWHNGIIGAAGIIGILLLSIIAYFANAELLARLSVYYAFSNLLPISNLDGAQIFFGSRIIYTILAVITLILTLYAFIL